MPLRRLHFGAVDDEGGRSGRFALMLDTRTAGEDANITVRAVPAQRLVRAVARTAVRHHSRDGIPSAALLRVFKGTDLSSGSCPSALVAAVVTVATPQLIQQGRSAHADVTRLGRDVAGIALGMRVLLDVVVFGVIASGRSVRSRSGPVRPPSGRAVAVGRVVQGQAGAADVAFGRRRDRVVLVVDVAPVAVVRRQDVAGTRLHHVVIASGRRGLIHFGRDALAILHDRLELLTVGRSDGWQRTSVRGGRFLRVIRLLRPRFTPLTSGLLRTGLLIVGRRHAAVVGHRPRRVLLVARPVFDVLQAGSVTYWRERRRRRTRRIGGGR